MKNAAKTKLIHNISSIRDEIKKYKEKKSVIGFAPTMGALHVGHESLIKKAKQDCDVVIVSIFVNPAQFGPSEDFDKYPRQLEQDRETCEKLGVDIIFAPASEELYPQSETFTNENLTMVIPPSSYQEKLCGKSRKGHFNGVATIVLKLFNIINPDRAYFGRKDAQQLIIIKKMVNDLNIPVQIIDCPTVREPDGLAFSSRNKYLDTESRKKADCIYKTLKNIEGKYLSGEVSAKDLINQAKKNIHADMHIEYFEALDIDTLCPVENITSGNLVAIAVKIKGVRLIDNIFL